MSLATELQAVYEAAHKAMPAEASQIIRKATADFKASYEPASAIQVGEPFPAFTLPDALGQNISSASLLAKGPLLISFYRGEWCPYCNLELRTLQKLLPQLAAKGVTLVAISPQLPDTSLEMKEKLELSFTVLSDVGNKLAREIGIVYKHPESMRGLLKNFGVDFEKRNGDATSEVPVPATFLVDGKGVVRNAFVDADFSKRLEPETALKWIDEL